MTSKQSRGVAVVAALDKCYDNNPSAIAFLSGVLLAMFNAEGDRESVVAIQEWSARRFPPR